MAIIDPEDDDFCVRHAERVEEMLDSYGCGDTEETVLEALADMMHLCDRDGVDFNAVLTKAKNWHGRELHTCDDECRSNGCKAR